MSLGGDKRLGPQLQRRILAFLAGEASQEAVSGSLEKRLEAKGATTAGKLVVHAYLNLRKQQFYCCKCLDTEEYHNKCPPLGAAWCSYVIFHMSHISKENHPLWSHLCNSFEAECSGGRCVGRCWWRGKGLARGGRSNKSSCGTIPTATCPAHKIPFGKLRWQWNCSQCSILNIYIYTHMYLYLHISATLQYFVRRPIYCSWSLFILKFGAAIHVPFFPEDCKIL